MKFQPGQSGNLKGRPVGSGVRSQALAILDEVIDDNFESLREALQDHLRRRPLHFFRFFVMPLIPKRMLMEHQIHSPAAPWRSFTEVLAEDDTTRAEISAVRQAHPGQDTRILDLIVQGIPVSALRIQMQNRALAAPRPVL